MFFTGQNKGKIPFFYWTFFSGFVYQDALAFDDIIQVLEFMGMVRGMAPRFNGKYPKRKRRCSVCLRDRELLINGVDLGSFPPPFSVATF
jgi:hypothetical protein